MPNMKIVKDQQTHPAPEVWFTLEVVEDECRIIANMAGGISIAIAYISAATGSIHPVKYLAQKPVVTTLRMMGFDISEGTMQAWVRNGA